MWAAARPKKKLSCLKAVKIPVENRLESVGTVQVILMWAIIAVYWIHPTHKLIVAEKLEDNCEAQGPDAWRGVWYSAT